MEAIPVRVLRNEPGKLEELLARDGTVILNKDGKPFAIAVDVAEASLGETVRLATQLRAQLAVTSIRLQARERGLDRMSPEQVDKNVKEIRAASK